MADRRAGPNRMITGATSPLTPGVLLEALALPPATRVDQRVPKKLLLEHGAPTAADRRLVQDGLDSLVWEAVLKPAGVGIPAYRDEARDYAEIAVLTATLRPGLTPARTARMIELVHRAVPYPVALIVAGATAHGTAVTLSLVHKRRSQAEADAAVAELPGVTATLGVAAAPEAAFVASLGLSAQPATHLFATYSGWVDRVTALEVARVTGRFVVPALPDDSHVRRQSLDEIFELRRAASALRAAAGRERQLARRVEMNLELRRLNARLAELTSTL